MKMKFDIQDLTLDEKIELLTGKNNWELNDANGKLPTMFLSDGPNGLRMHDKETYEIIKATQMPTLSLVANTWNIDLAYLDGETIADDCKENHANVLLAPGVNIKRTPLNGRNFEYFSEDPFLAGTMGKSYIEGVQSRGIGTSLKHFCANNSELDRHFISSEVDERTLREIYLLPFEIALEGKPWTVMCSYNPINGIWASENKWLLNDILRNEFGFNGVIVSDWGAVYNSYKSHKASLDIEMPHSENSFNQIKEAYDKGLITLKEIDDSVSRILALMEKQQNSKRKKMYTKKERHENALAIAREGIVLLKNEDNILPLTSGNILVNGYDNAEGGSGSARVQTSYKKKSLDQELAIRLKDKANIITSSCYLDSVCIRNHKDAFLKASEADSVVLMVSTGDTIEGEGFDRTSIKLNKVQEDYINYIAKYNPNVVVVINAGSAIDMTNWINNVKGVIYAGFAGEASNEAIADIISGIVSPSGKLTETFPLSLDDVPAVKLKHNALVERYDEGIYVGYRYYDTFDKPVLFPFGFGLSYAKFTYSNMKIEKYNETSYDVVFNITNESDIEAKEVAQLYVRDVFSNVSKPLKELKGFIKVSLLPHETKTVNISLDFRSFAFYSIPLHKWHIENGLFEIIIGSSSKKKELRKNIEIKLPDETQYTI